MFLPSIVAFLLSLVMKESFEVKLFSLFFSPPSQYKFRDLTIEELKNVSKTYPNFTFSMNTYSKKWYSYFELFVGILTCHKCRLHLQMYNGMWIYLSCVLVFILTCSKISHATLLFLNALPIVHTYKNLSNSFTSSYFILLRLVSNYRRLML